jgi:hypothetical protein
MTAPLTRRIRAALPIVACTVLVQVASGSAQARSGVETRETIDLRGRDQVLHLYGARGGTPVIVSSGDGGWIHLGPHVAEVLSVHAESGISGPRVVCGLPAINTPVDEHGHECFEAELPPFGNGAKLVIEAPERVR